MYSITGKYSYFNYFKAFHTLHKFTPFSMLSSYPLYNTMYCSFLMTHKSTQTFFSQ